MAYSNYYVDPAAGNDGTGDGTIGTPWKTVQHALDTITRNSTDGDRINVKAGTADTLGAALSLATYGAPVGASPLIIQGYTSAAGDGGIGEINGAGSYAIISTTGCIRFADMKLGNCGSAVILTIGELSEIWNCEVHTTSGIAVIPGTSMRIVGNWFHDCTGTLVIDNNAFQIIAHNYFDVGATTSIIELGSGGMSVLFANIIYLSGADTSVNGVHLTAHGQFVAHNVIVSSNANTGRGIYGQYGFAFLENNIIQGWSGAGGDAIQTDTVSTLAANAYYNNTANETDGASAKWRYTPKASVALGATPFVDAANGDFSLTAAAKTALAAKGWPTSYFGAHANTVPNLNIGPIQMAAGGAAGGGFPILGGSVVR